MQGGIDRAREGFRDVDLTAQRFCAAPQHCQTSQWRLPHKSAVCDVQAANTASARRAKRRVSDGEAASDDELQQKLAGVTDEKEAKRLKRWDARIYALFE